MMRGKHNNIGLSVLCTLALAWMLALGLHAPAYADGSGPLSPFPLAGAYSATFREDRDHISVIDIAGNYNKVLDTGQLNVEPRAVIAQEFLRTHPDNYDFIVAFSTFEFDTGDALAFHWSVQNKVQGIGLPQFDVSSLFGSQGKLQGFIDMAALTRWTTDPLDPEFERTLSVTAHEVLHQWGSHVKFQLPDGTLSDALLGRDGAHWSYLLDSDASVEYGAKWRDNSDGTFTSVGIRTFFSPLDLYLMGMYRADEVPPFFLIENSSIDKMQLPQENVTVSGTKRVVTIEDIVAAEGPRVPDAANAQKEFRFAFVLLTGPGEQVSDAQILALNHIRNAFMTRFAILTGGRGVAHIYPEALPVAEAGTPTTVGGGALRTDPANFDEALAWLRGRQQPEGYWDDKPSTRLRDTAVALETLSKLDTSFAGSGTALSWLGQQTPGNTDYLARSALAVVHLGGNALTMHEQLAALQNSDGGWGIADGYRSNPLDTALAVQALATQGGLYGAAINQAVSYLWASQNPDGGWSGAGGGPSRSSVTATALQAMKAVGQQGAAGVTSALGWLAGKQNPDGGFGDSPSTVHDSALALQTFMDLEALDRIEPDATASYLLGLQTVGGDWAGSTYATSLAVAALKRFSFANWVITDPVTAEPASPNDGERVKITAIVRNDSNVATEQGMLRIYDGDPAVGGTPIGSDIVIPPMPAGTALSFTQLWDTFDKPGNHTLVAVVDPDSAAIEMSERDNRGTVDVQVQAAPDGIDLAVAAPDITIIPEQPNRLPTTLGINVNLRNLGVQDATNVKVVLWDGPAGIGTLVGETTLDVLGRSTVAANFSYVLTQPGTTTFTVQLDPDSAISEVSESNNNATKEVTTAPSVDLVVTGPDITLDKTPVYVGDDVTFTIKLHNNGTTESPSTSVRYLVTDGAATTELRTNTVQIGAGQTIEQTITWRVDLTGTVTFTAQLDPDALVPELDEANNAGSLIFNVGTAEGPNLATAFQDFTFNPDPGNEGSSVTLTALVRNTGNQPASDVAVAFYNGDPAQGGTLIGSQQVVATLAAGESSSISVVWDQIPDSTDKLLFVAVDPDNTITEFSETDNDAFNVLSVLSLPDLAISAGDIQLSPAFPSSGDTVTIGARVSNLGQQGAANVLVRAYDGDPVTGGTLIGEQTLASLAGNSATVVNFSLTFAGSGAVRPIVVQVDPLNAVLERFTNNNTARRDVAVQDGNFHVSNPYFSPNGDGVKDDTQLFFRLSVAADVAVEVVKERDAVVRRIVGDNLKNVTDGSVTWDGLDDMGRLVSDGEYRLRVVDVTGVSLGEAVVSLDTNRSSILKAADTPYERFTNLTCELPNTNDLVFTEDEETAFFRIVNTDANVPGYPKGIYRMSKDGSDVRVVVSEAWFGQESRPEALAAAKDGSRVFFVRQLGGSPRELWVVAADGTGLTRLDGGTMSLGWPSTQLHVSADGKTVYLVDGYGTGLYAFSIDNPGVAQSLYTAQQNIFEVEISQATGKIAVLADSSPHKALIIDPSTGSVAQLDEIDSVSYRFAWSPDGNLLAVANGAWHGPGTINVYDNIGNPREIFQAPEAIVVEDVGKPQWSANSAEFAISIHGETADGGGGYGLGVGVATVSGDAAGPEPGGIFIADVATGGLRLVAQFQRIFGYLSYHVSTWDGSNWTERGVLHYGRHYREQSLDLSQHLPDPDGEYKVRIRQHGLEAAHVESVALVLGRNRFVPSGATKLVPGTIDGTVDLVSGTPEGEDVLEKVRYPDSEVLDLHEAEMEVRWTDVLGNGPVKLALIAREEDLRRVKTLPFSYPENPNTGFHYSIADDKPLVLDGRQQANDQLGTPLFAIFSRPNTGHPPGTVYGYVSGDEKYLYGVLDFTVDNTLDGDKDWAALRVRSGGDWKEFRVTTSETTYGIAGFTKTGKVSYTHKYYEFKIPLSEFGATVGETVEVSFQAYGTAAIIIEEGDGLPRNGQVLWTPGERAIVYDASYEGQYAIFLGEDNRIQRLFEDWPGSLYDARFLPSGRKLLFKSNRASNDPTSICYRKGWTDSWSFESLLNLVADLRAVRSARAGGAILRGTASDLNFNNYLLEYTPVSAAEAWRPVAPASGQPVVDDVFTTWVPPGPGTYFVRLTATDLAGNTRQVVKRVSWNDSVSITDLYRTPRIFSPNGDGTQDEVIIHYRVLEPVHLEFSFYNAQGDQVRTIKRDHTLIGAEFDLIWDGRDDSGLPLPDGEYRLRVQNYEFSITVDSMAPAVEVSLTDPYQYYEFDQGDSGIVRYAAVRPELIWDATDSHLDASLLESGLGENPDPWEEVTEPALRTASSGRVPLSVADFTNRKFRVTASDTAGNRMIASTPLGKEQLIITSFGNLDIVRTMLGTDYKVIDPVRYAPMGGDSPSYLSAVVEPRDVRMQVSETIRGQIVQMYFQYRKAGSDIWQEAPVKGYLLFGVDFPTTATAPQHSMEVKWTLANLQPGLEYILRLRAIDASGTEHLSNAFRFAIEGYRFNGLIQDAGIQQYEHIIEPLLKKLNPPLGEDEYGLWGQEVVAEPIAEVRLYVQSDEDPRYALPKLVDTVAYPDGGFIFRTKELETCKNYRGYIVLLAEAGADGAQREIGRTAGYPFHVPCIELETKTEVVFAKACGDPSPNKVHVKFAPIVRDGSQLKLLTLSRQDPQTGEDVVFNINQPDSVLPPGPGYKPKYNYAYTLDTNGLPEGPIDFTAHLVNVNDEEVTADVRVMVDHTPPIVDFTYPLEGQRVCGIPRRGVDDVVRNILTVEGSVNEANGWHYLVELGNGVDEASYEKVDDSRSHDSFKAANGGGAGIVPSRPNLHRSGSFSGPVAEIVDRNGDYTARLRVFDEGGFQQCAVRSFYVDAQVEARQATVDRKLFSPDGDGVLDEITVTYEVDEPVTLDIDIYAATRNTDGSYRITGPVIRDVETGLTVLTGISSSLWDGADNGGNRVSDGLYGIVLTYRDGCGNLAEQKLFVEVDNTPPAVSVNYPQATDPMTMIVEVLGSASDLHFQGYSVEYGMGSAPDAWVGIGNGTREVNSDLLAAWNTFGLEGDHVLRLHATDSAGNASEIQIPLTLATRTNLLSYLEAVPSLFSPNDDGRREQTAVRLGVEDDITLAVNVLTSGDALVRTLVADQAVSRGEVVYAWDGRDDQGQVAADGNYTVRVVAALTSNPAVKQEESITVTVDATAPLVDITRPTGGFVSATGGITGTIQDAYIKQYTIEVTDAPSAPSWQELASGTSNRLDAVFASLEGYAEGEHALRVMARDEAENVTQQIIPFEVDNTTPQVDILAPADGAVVGVNKAPAEVKALVEDKNLRAYTLNIGAGDAPQTWTELIHGESLPIPDPLTALDLAGLPDGLQTLQLIAEDKAGNTAEKRIRITVDNTPPTISITVPSEGGYIKGPMDIVGSATDANFVDYRLFVAPGAKDSASRWSEIGSGTAAVDNGVLLALQALPPDGLQTLKVEARDSADNVAQLLLEITVDTHPPSPPTGLIATVENKQDVHLIWDLNPEPDVVGYLVYRNGQQVTPTPIPTPEYLDQSVAQGTYEYTVTAWDRADWESDPSDPAEARVDITPPTATLSRPGDGAVVSGLLDVLGTAYSDGDFKEYRLSVGEGAAPDAWQLLRRSPVPMLADVLAQWNTVVLPEGAQYTVKLEAEDINGNVGSDQATVTIDNQPPAAPTGLVAILSGSDVNLTWNPNAEPDLLGYLVFRNDRLANATGAVVGDLRPYAVITASYPDLSLPDGPYAYTVVAIDQAGNMSDPSLPSEVLIDTRPPHAVISAPEDGSAFETPLYVLATSEDSDIAQVEFQYRAVGGADWTTLGGPDTSAPYELMLDPVALGLNYGDYEIQAIATDTGVKVDPSPVPITVTYIDLTRPLQVADLSAQVNGGNVALTWTANTEGDIAGYHVDRIDEQGATTRLTSTPVTGTSYLDAGLTDATYRYTVSAVDTSGNEGDPSGEANALVYTPVLQQPYTPTEAVTVTLQGQSPVPATVAGDVTTETGTQVLPPVSTEPDNSFVVADLPLALGSNAFAIVLTDSAGNVSKQATATVVRGGPPSQPTGLTAAAVGYDVSLTWNANPEPDVIGYRVFRNGEPQLPDVPVTGLSATASDNEGLAGNAVDTSLSSAWGTNNSSDHPAEGQWLAVSWMDPVSVTQVKLQWRYLDYRPLAYDLEAWAGTGWVQVAQVRDNAEQVNIVELPAPYRTTQLRMVIRQANLPSGYYQAVRLADISLMAQSLETSTTFVDIAPDGVHDYTVTAVNALGFASIPSDPAQVPVGDVTPPEPVTLSATVAASDVILTWTPSPSADVVRYDVYRDGQEIAQQSDLAALSYTDIGRPNGTYIYNVRAADGAGNASQASNDASATVIIAPPVVPVSLAVTPVPEGQALDLAWQPDGGSTPAGYRVSRSATAGGPYDAVVDTQAVTLRDSGLINGTTYYYVVRALDSLGNTSANSNEASGTPQDAVAPDVQIHYPARPGSLYVTDKQFVTAAGSTEPGATVTLSHDGIDVATVQARAAMEISSANMDAGYWKKILSPDGRYAIRVLDSSLYLYSIAGGDSVFIANLNHWDDPYARWTHDGRGIVFTAYDPDRYRYYLREYRLADGSLLNLTDPAVMTESAYAGFLSPDGGTLVYIADSGIWKQDLATDVRTHLLAEDYWYFDLSSFQWSPDSSRIAYRRYSPQNAIEVIEVASSGVTGIEAQAGYSPPSWSPDSKYLVYTARRSGWDQLWRYTFADGSTEMLVAGANYHVFTPVYAPGGQHLAYFAGYYKVELFDLTNGEIADLLTGTYSSITSSLQWVDGGHLSVWMDDNLHRIAPAGHFEFRGIRLHDGDNVLSARAMDDSGNTSTPSAGIVLNYRLGDKPDLAVMDDDIVVLPAAPLAGEATRVTISVRNVGTAAAPASAVTLYAVAPAGDSTVLLEGADLTPLPAGGAQTLSAEWTVGADFGTYALVAIVDQADEVLELSEANNLAIKEVLAAGEARPQLALSTDKPAYTANEEFTATVQVSNSGSEFAGRLQVTVEDTAGDAVEGILVQDVTNLAYADSLNVTAAWNTGTTFAGGYQVHARLTDGNGQLIAETAAPFSIGAVAGLVSQVITDQPQYTANTDVLVTGTVDYTDGNSILSGTAVRIRIEDSGGAVLAEKLRTLGDLLPGATNTVTLVWNTGRLPMGAYPVRLEVMKDAQAVSTASASLTIEAGAAQISGTLQLSTVAPGIGEAQTASYTLVNQGNDALAQLPVIVSLFDPDQQTIIESAQNVLDIVVDGSGEGSALFDTQGLALKTYTVLLQADVAQTDGSTVRAVFATASFRVVDRVPPVVELRQPVDGGYLRGDAKATVYAIDAHSGVQGVEISVDGGPWTPAPIDNAAASLYSDILPGLAEGVHSLAARATDTWENTRTTTANSFVVDNIAPSIVINGVVEGVYYNQSITPEVIITDGNLDVMSIALDGQVFTSGTAVATEGQHKLVAFGQDKAGNATQQDVTFTVDTTAPAIIFTGVDPNGSYNTDVVPNVQVVDANLNSYTITLNGQPFASGAVVTAEGAYELIVIADDLAGNQAQQTLRFVIDRTPPVVTVTAPANDSTLTVEVASVEGSTESQATVFLAVGGYQSSTLAGETGEFLFSDVPLAVGRNELQLYAQDRAGNIGTVATVVVNVQTYQLAGDVFAARGVLVWAPERAYDDYYGHHGGSGGYQGASTQLLDLISTTLEQKGLDYTIVLDEVNFLEALRTQRYGTVMILETHQSSAYCSDGSGGMGGMGGGGMGGMGGMGGYLGGGDGTHLEVSDATRIEIASMVASGSGMIWIKTHPDSNQLWEDIVGAKAKCVIEEINQVVLEDSPASAAGTWVANGAGLKVQLNGGLAVGTLEPADNAPALVLNSYGRGKAALVTFDPATLSDVEGAKTVVGNIVRFAEPTRIVHLPGDEAEVVWTATDIQPPLAAQFDEHLADDMRFIYSWDGVVTPPQDATWTRDIETPQEAFRAVVELPPTKGSYSIEARLSRLEDGVPFMLVGGTLSGTIDKDKDSLAIELLDELNALTVPDADRDELQAAIQYVQEAIIRSQTTKADIEYSITKLLGAMSELSQMTTDAPLAKELLGYLLRAYQIRWGTF